MGLFDFITEAADIGYTIAGERAAVTLAAADELASGTVKVGTGLGLMAYAGANQGLDMAQAAAMAAGAQAAESTADYYSWSLDRAATGVDAFTNTPENTDLNFIGDTFRGWSDSLDDVSDDLAAMQPELQRDVRIAGQWTDENQKLLEAGALVTGQGALDLGQSALYSAALGASAYPSVIAADAVYQYGTGSDKGLLGLVASDISGIDDVAIDLTDKDDKLISVLDLGTKPKKMVSPNEWAALFEAWSETDSETDVLLNTPSRPAEMYGRPVRYSQNPRNPIQTATISVDGTLYQFRTYDSGAVGLPPGQVKRDVMTSTDRGRTWRFYSGSAASMPEASAPETTDDGDYQAQYFGATNSLQSFYGELGDILRALRDYDGDQMSTVRAAETLGTTIGNALTVDYDATVDPSVLINSARAMIGRLQALTE